MSKSKKGSKRVVSTKKKVVTTENKKEQKKGTSPSSRKRSSSSRRRSRTVSPSQEPMIFDKRNYMLMGAGVVLIALGLLLMGGGQMPSPDVWDEGILYSPRRTVIAPILIMAGLVVEIFAIFRN